MSSFFKHIAGILLVVGWVFNCNALDDARNERFFDSVATRLYDAYRECTGDSRPADLKRVMFWKRSMDVWTESEEFSDVMRDYVKNVDSSGAITPCKLIEWSKSRKRAQDAKEMSAVHDILDNYDSAEAAKDLKASPQSLFDAPGIPFGVSRAMFPYLFKKKFTATLFERGRFFYTEEFPLNGRLFLAAFFFNSAGIFYKYEIESDPLPADSLNRSVRPAAEHLAYFFEQRLGPPTHHFRIGFFDIKSRELALSKNWETPAHFLNLGFSVFEYQYYAKVVVVDKKLLLE